jgi:prolyl 4-hydroxylase
LVPPPNVVSPAPHTVFPALGLATSPLRGNAIYFEYGDDRGQVDARSLHGSAAVTQGDKWVVTKWMRQRRFVSAGGG